MGNGTKKRERQAQLNAYRLKQQGLTTRQIAQQLGKRPEQIPSLIVLGERFSKEDGSSG